MSQITRTTEVDYYKDRFIWFDCNYRLFKEANLHRRFSIAIAKCEARKMQKRRVKDRTYYWSGFSKPKQYLLSEAQCMA